MTDEEIKNEIKAYGFDPETESQIYRLCKEIERQTKQSYYRLIQDTNNAIINNQQITITPLKETKT